MFASDQYALIEFGDGLKIERFSGRIVRRETPSAQGPMPQAKKLPAADFDFGTIYGKGDRPQWREDASQPWQLKLTDAPVTFELRTTPSGQVGIFPEQAENWQWILQHRQRLKGKRALNLFGYTGGTSLILASIGCQVVHVDAASSVVRWARRNAELSGLADAPIRWIVEDAQKFLRREIKRGNRYDIVIADPPSFGRGPKGETWKLETDLASFLKDLFEVCRPSASGIISCHTPGLDARKLEQLCQACSPGEAFQRIDLTLETEKPAQRTLPSGACVRWIAAS